MNLQTQRMVFKKTRDCSMAVREKTVHNTNTQVAGSTVTIDSGGDTTLQGAVVQGNQVTATVGGNLNIQSLQDTSQFKESSKSAGGSVMVGITNSGPVSGNVNLGRTSINSTFTSVGEQSAIRARDGGFNVNVAGKTDLVGGQITSSQAAVDNNKNSFSSAGGVQTQDLQNQASFSANSVSVGLGTGSPVPGQSLSAGMSGVGIGSDKGSASSTTTAGISGVAGNTQARTGDQEIGLKPIFNKDEVRSEVNAQVAITSEFGKHAPKLVADYTQTQRETIKLQALQAERSGDPQSASRLRDEAARWDEGGAYHVGLQTITGALSGGAGGALGAAGVAAAAPLIESITAKLPLPEPLQAVAGMVIASAIGASAGGSAGAAMGFNVDTNNRSLHSSERKTAIALAKASDGRYSEEEIVAQLRQMPNMLLASAGDKDAATGAPEMYANMQDPAIQARWQQERKDDPNMQVNVSGVSMMERQSPANGELQAFIVSATTFPSGPLAGRSPYVLTPAAASQILNQAAAEERANAPAQPRHHNCASTECLLMGANYNPNNPQNRAEMERREGALKAAGVIITGPALLAAAATPAGQAALQTLLWNKAAATGASAGAGANAAVQYATTGKVDPVGVVVGAATGALGAGAVVATKATTESVKLIHGIGLTSAVGINAAGAAVTNSEQGATAGATIVAYPFGQIPLVGPLLGAFAQEALTTIFSSNSSTATKTNSSRGGQ